MRCVRTLIVCLVAALALSGCMRRPAPVAVAQPRGDLDAIAYGRPAPVPVYVPPPVAMASPGGANSGGAFAALRAGFASRRNAATVAAVPVRYAAPVSSYDASYRLDAGDRLRIVVYGQEGLTNSYAIDAGGAITMPLIGAVTARGRTPAGLAGDITARLRDGFIREPSVAVEIEAYRPFFILGEVKSPGQYPYANALTAFNAIATAQGFTPRADRKHVYIRKSGTDGEKSYQLTPDLKVLPGDTLRIGERYF